MAAQQPRKMSNSPYLAHRGIRRCPFGPRVYVPCASRHPKASFSTMPRVGAGWTQSCHAGPSLVATIPCSAHSWEASTTREKSFSSFCQTLSTKLLQPSGPRMPRGENRFHFPRPPHRIPDLRTRRSTQAGIPVKGRMAIQTSRLKNGIQGLEFVGWDLHQTRAGQTRKSWIECTKENHKQEKEENVAESRVRLPSGAAGR